MESDLTIARAKLTTGHKRYFQAQRFFKCLVPLLFSIPFGKYKFVLYSYEFVSALNMHSFVLIFSVHM